MDLIKKKGIEAIVDASIKNFAEGLGKRYTKELNDQDGVINRKKYNCFIAELGQEFMFYSAFVRSFDSSFGRVLENMGNSIATLTYTVNKDVKSFLPPQQTQHIDYLMGEYEKHTKPLVEHYTGYTGIIPSDIRSFEKSHVTDHYFFDEIKNEHYLIELKSSGDLDNKKAKTEKLALLQEYFILKNSLPKNAKIKIYFATAYNMYGEGNPWKQERVKQFFADDELLIGKDYWNFVCGSEDGFDIVFNQYKKSSAYIKQELENIKDMYFEK